MNKWYICDVLVSNEDGCITVAVKNRNTEAIKLWQLDAMGEGKLMVRQLDNSSLSVIRPDEDRSR